MSTLVLSSQYVFGLFLLLAFAAGFVTLRQRARTLNLDLHLFEQWLPWLILCALICARLFALFALDFADIIQTQWWRIFYFWDGNLSLWGAIIGFMLPLVFFCKKHKQSFGKWADALIRPFFIMLFFGRLGNFFDGAVYYGQPTDSFLGITIDDIFFPLSGIKHYPIALYEALVALAIFSTGVIWRRNIVPGSRFCILMMIYAAWRFAIEYLRFDAVEIYENITWDQTLSALVFLGCLTALIIQHARTKKSPALDG